MADIAMLVAEEYERRIKNSSKVANQEKQQLLGQELVHYLSQVAVRINKAERLEVFKWVLEPQSQLGLAASHGFFSA